MKKTLLIAAMMATTVLAAQPGQDRDREPNAEIQAKKMTLALDLTDKQENQIITILRENNEQMQKLRPKKEGRKEMTQKQRESHQLALLDQRIAVQRKMKDILTDDQFDQWKVKMEERAKKKMRQRGTTDRKERR